MKAWFILLDGNISVPVYCDDAPASEYGNYLLLRIESDSDTPNNHAWFNNPVLITEIVTKFETRVNYELAGEIDNEVSGLLFPGNVPNHALPAQAGIQITSVQRRDATYLPEDDGTFRYKRLVTRNIHRVIQL